MCSRMHPSLPSLPLPRPLSPCDNDNDNPLSPSSSPAPHPHAPQSTTTRPDDTTTTATCPRCTTTTRQQQRCPHLVLKHLRQRPRRQCRHHNADDALVHPIPALRKHRSNSTTHTIVRVVLLLLLPSPLPWYPEVYP